MASPVTNLPAIRANIHLQSERPWTCMQLMAVNISD